jgi:hypothetical protein
MSEISDVSIWPATPPRSVPLRPALGWPLLAKRVDLPAARGRPLPASRRPVSRKPIAPSNE